MIKMVVTLCYWVRIPRIFYRKYVFSGSVVGSRPSPLKYWADLKRKEEREIK
jgi:hypothetical protein